MDSQIRSSKDSSSLWNIQIWFADLKCPICVKFTIPLEHITTGGKIQLAYINICLVIVAVRMLEWCAACWVQQCALAFYDEEWEKDNKDGNDFGHMTSEERLKDLFGLGLIAQFYWSFSLVEHAFHQYKQLYGCRKCNSTSVPCVTIATSGEWPGLHEDTWQNKIGFKVINKVYGPILSPVHYGRTHILPS